MIQEIEKCVSQSESFALETTLSGLSYAKKINGWRNQGYKIILYYFSLPSVEFAIDRVRYRVSQGGHDIPEKDIRRPYTRSYINFEKIFKPIVDTWVEFDTSSSYPVLVGESVDDT